MRPIKPLVPGKPISASEMNRAAEETRRAANPSADVGLDRFRGPMGDSTRDARLPSMWVKITGPVEDGSGGGSGGVPPEYHYAGVQLIDQPDTDPPYEELEAGAVFDETYPLIEMSGNADVPEGLIVRAYPADAQPGYTFVYGEPVDDGSGSGDCGGTSERSNTVTFESTTCDANGDPCTTRTTITFPFAVTVCTEPCDSGSGSGG
jgi:hypothetical protein